MRKITWGWKISQAKMGHKVSEETKRKISLAMRGKLAGERNPAKREDVRKKISLAMKGKSKSLKHRQKLSLVHKGKRVSLATEFKKGYGMNKMDKNPAWRGGKSFEPYIPEFNNELKNKIRKRDGYKCKECGKTQEEELKIQRRKLQVHHIDYNKKNNNESNLISLCNGCHGKTDWGRNEWRAHFKNHLFKS